MDKTDMKGLLCHVRKLGLFPAGYGALTGGCKQGCEVIVALVKDGSNITALAGVLIAPGQHVTKLVRCSKTVFRMWKSWLASRVLIRSLGLRGIGRPLIRIMVPNP